MAAPTGVLLMTFGSATTSAHVESYLRSVRRGSDPPADVVAEFQRRYDLVGHSPLLEITQAQAAALQDALDQVHGRGAFVVGCGMRHSAPSIEDAVAELAVRGATSVLGVVMSPQYSPVIMAGYHQALEAAGATNGIPVRVAEPWYDVDQFVQTLADSVGAALAEFPAAVCDTVPVIFTAHSLPRSVIDRDQAYLDQIQATVEAVAERSRLKSDRWQFAYQSAGHSPEEWLTPDFKDLLPGFRDSGHAEVLVVPTQFLADHLEILYDIDIAGAEEAHACGMHFRRIKLPNTAPQFIAALVAVVDRELANAL